jgi:hypothetical protein
MAIAASRFDLSAKALQFVHRLEAWGAGLLFGAGLTVGRDEELPLSLQLVHLGEATVYLLIFFTPQKHAMLFCGGFEQ